MTHNENVETTIITGDEMRPREVERAELIDRLKTKFGIDEPIFTEEIITSWNEYSAPRVYQLLREFCTDGTITKYSYGVYFFQKIAFWGKPLSLSAEKVAKKRYMQNGDKIYGYYSGLTLFNMVGLTNQVPFVREIVTMNETTRLRNVMIGGRRFRIRRAKTEITKENAPLFKILDIFSERPLKIERPLDRVQIENLIVIAGGGRIDSASLEECAKFFPKRALQNLKRSEIGYLVA